MTARLGSVSRWSPERTARFKATMAARKKAAKARRPHHVTPHPAQKAVPVVTGSWWLLSQSANERSVWFERAEQEMGRMMTSKEGQRSQRRVVDHLGGGPGLNANRGAEMRRDVLVYISGPMTAKDGRTIEENVAAGVRVFLDCLKRGVPAFSPHLGGAFPSAWSEVSWESWLQYDLAIIDRCTHILMMPRWETSAGAVREREYAEAIGRPVILSIDELKVA